MKTELINVDLELYSKTRLSKVAEEWNGKVSVLNEGEILEGEYEYRGEVSIGCGADSIDEIIEKFLTLVEDLTQHGKEEINSCRKRVFNIGIDCGTKTHCEEFSISQKNVQDMAREGFGITICIYRPSDDEINREA